jgi:ABC-type nickel/cobalt efflux system permease component RcnA
MMSRMDHSLLLALGLGFLLGLRHALEADHLVAVTTVVSDERSLLRSSLVGALWGVGHTASLLAAGVLVILLRVAIPERVASVLEFAVALMIIGLGGRVLYLALRGRRTVHVHTHDHGTGTHTHLHFHDREDAHAVGEKAEHDSAGHRHGAALGGWRSVAVGAVHGLAGSAVLTLFVLNEVVSGGGRALGFAYLLCFGLGSIVGMLLMSALVSLPFILTAGRFESVNIPVRLLTGLLSVAFGIFYAWETGPGLWA